MAVGMCAVCVRVGGGGSSDRACAGMCRSEACACACTHTHTHGHTHTHARAHTHAQVEHEDPHLRQLIHDQKWPAVRDMVCMLELHPARCVTVCVCMCDCVGVCMCCMMCVRTHVNAHQSSGRPPSCARARARAHTHTHTHTLQRHRCMRPPPASRTTACVHPQPPLPPHARQIHPQVQWPSP